LIELGRAERGRPEPVRFIEGDGALGTSKLDLSSKLGSLTSCRGVKSVGVAGLDDDVTIDTDPNAARDRTGIALCSMMVLSAEVAKGDMRGISNGPATSRPGVGGT